MQILDERRIQSDPVTSRSERDQDKFLRSPEHPEVLLSLICWVEGQEQDQEEQVEQQSGQEQEQEGRAGGAAEQEEQAQRKEPRQPLPQAQPEKCIRR